MTEQQNQSAVVEETREAVETTPQPENNDKKKAGNKTSLALSAIAIAIAIAAGIGLYGLNKQQATRQNATTSELSGQLAALQKAQESQKSELEGIIKQQADQLSQAKHEQETLTKQLDELQQKVAVISGSDAKTWLLAQADFLVKLAGRKLWSDQDVTTAAALLKSADASLADMNDPSLIGARRAITDDIATLSAVSQVDYDGMILKVNQLANQIDNLRLADNNDDDSPMDSDSDELSSSISEWRVNLQKSWQNFMDSFITVRRRDETAVRCWRRIRISICGKIFALACWSPRRQCRAIRKRPGNSRWITSRPGYAPITILMTPPPKPSSTRWISSVSKALP